MKRTFENLSEERKRVLVRRGLLVAAGTLGFLLLAWQVMAGNTLSFDSRIVTALRQPGNPALLRGPLWLAHGARDLTALGSYTLLSVIVFSTVGFLLLQRSSRAAWQLLLTAVGGAVVSSLLKLHYGRGRPDVMPLTYAVSPSFPSGHALLSAVVYLTLGVLMTRVEPNRTVRIYILGVAILLTFMIGLTRVYLGAHYPTDVLAGWTAGLVWALLCWMVPDSLHVQGRPGGSGPES